MKLQALKPVKLFGRRRWLVLEDTLVPVGNGHFLCVSAGSVIDGASIPRIFTWLLSPVGYLLEASAPHDIAYMQQRVTFLSEAGEQWTEQVTRRQADDLFYASAIRTDTPKPIAFAAWVAVRIGGWWPWCKHAIRLG